MELQPGSAAEVAAAVHRQRAEIEGDKGGICVSTRRELPPPPRRGEHESCVYRLRNGGRASRRLRALKLVPAAAPGGTFELVLPSAVQLPLELPPGFVLDVELVPPPEHNYPDRNSELTEIYYDFEIGSA